MASGGLRYYLSLDASGFSKGARQAEGDIKSLTGRVGAFARSNMGMATAVGAGAAAVSGFAAVVQHGMRGLIEHEKVAAQTTATIKSTGGAANVTRQQIEDLATALERKTGADGDAIQSGQNLLLTFTNVRNEAGKGRDIFTQTTRTMLDMSVAMGQSTTTSAIQLGKALNDPVKGVTALTKVGVTFTQAQRDQIAAAVKAGDTYKAQGVILAELNKEFGGSAAAQGNTLAGKVARFGRAWDEASETVASAFIPTMERAADWARENTDSIQRFAGGVATAVAGMAAFAADIIDGDWQSAWNRATTGAGKALRAIGELAKRVLFPLAKQAGEKVVEGLAAGIDAGLSKIPGSAFLRKMMGFDVPTLEMNVGVNVINRGGGFAGSYVDTTGNVSSVRNAPSRDAMSTGPRRTRAMGGWIPGVYDARDDVPAMLSRGEVVLNPAQAQMVGVSRINNALAATGGVLGGNHFARGGVVQAAYDRAVGKLGTKYVYGSWDCSKFATYVAGVGVGGTTATAYGQSRPARGDEPIVWGFRRNGGGNVYDGGRDEHMGVRVNGRWFDNGSNGVESNADSQRWQQIRVPAGLENLVAGADTGTATRDAPAKNFGQILREAFGNGRIGKTWTGASDVTTGGPGGSETAAGGGGRPLTTKDVAGAYRGGVPDLSEGFGTSPDGSDQRGIDKAGRDARARARAAGRSPEEVRKAGDDAEENATKKWYRNEIKQIIKAMTGLKNRKKRLLAALRVMRVQKAKNLASKRQAIRALNNRIVQINAELSELREIKAELENALGEIIDEGQMDDYEEGYPEPADTESGSETTESKTTSTSPGLTDYLASIGEFSAVKRGAGDLGAGGRTAWDASWTPAGGAVTVVVQTLHPGDPSVLAEVGRTVVASMSGLPSTPSTTYMSGA